MCLDGLEHGFYTVKGLNKSKHSEESIYSQQSLKYLLFKFHRKSLLTLGLESHNLEAFTNMINILLYLTFFILKYARLNDISLESTFLMLPQRFPFCSILNRNLRVNIC